MSTDRIVPNGDRYTVTSAGREAADASDTCYCIIERQGDVFTCKLCGTVWQPTRRSFGSAGRDHKGD